MELPDCLLGAGAERAGDGTGRRVPSMADAECYLHTLPACTCMWLALPPGVQAQSTLSSKG